MGIREKPDGREPKGTKRNQKEPKMKFLEEADFGTMDQEPRTERRWEGGKVGTSCTRVWFSSSRLASLLLRAGNVTRCHSERSEEST